MLKILNKMGSNKIKINRIGEKFVSNSGYEFEIIEYISSEDITIKFFDNAIRKHCYYVHIKNGNIKHPFLTNKSNNLILGIGYLGIGKYTSKNNNYYKKWQMMLFRCYDKKTQSICPTY